MPKVGRRPDIKIKIGKIFGNLKVISLTIKNGRKYAICECSCGNVINVRYYNLVVVGQKSCGCIQKYNGSNITHGLSKNKLYRIYQGILNRCNNEKNPNYKHYGGRGIKCEWKNVSSFIRDMGEDYKEGLEIDRINNDGNYSRINCRWVTRKENCRNRRSNIKFLGRCVYDWCNDLGLNSVTIYHRINYLGWSVEDAILTPIKKRIK